MADLDSSLFSRRPAEVRLIAAGATERTRNRVPTVDRTRWFDQRVGVEPFELVTEPRKEATMLSSTTVDVSDAKR